MSGVGFVLGNGGLGRKSPSVDPISGLVFSGVAVVGGLTLSTSYKLASLDDAVALGINQAYDATNSVAVYQHIAEFFRINPDTHLWIFGVSRSTSYANMLDPNVNHSAIKLVRDAQGEISQIGVAYNPTVAVTDFSATFAAITKAQELADVAFGEKMPLCVLLEGKGFDYSDITDINTVENKNVSIFVHQHFNHPTYVTDPTGAAIGTALAVVSLARVNDCIGWVGKYSGVANLEFAQASISGDEISTLAPSVFEDCANAGYNFLLKYPGKTGLYFNDSRTCTPITSDYAYIENVRTINKAIRLVYQALLPFVNSTVLINTSNGNIAAETVASWEAVANKAILPMFTADEISGPDPNGATPPVTIDPAQDVLSTSLVNVKLSIVPTGTARTITVYVGFTNPAA